MIFIDGRAWVDPITCLLGFGPAHPWKSSKSITSTVESALCNRYHKKHTKNVLFYLFSIECMKKQGKHYLFFLLFDLNNEKKTEMTLRSMHFHEVDGWDRPIGSHGCSHLGQFINLNHQKALQASLFLSFVNQTHQKQELHCLF